MVEFLPYSFERFEFLELKILCSSDSFAIEIVFKYTIDGLLSLFPFFLEVGQ